MKSITKRKRSRARRPRGWVTFGPGLAILTKYIHPDDDECVVVPLTQGKFALVDPEDWERVLRRKWQATHTGDRGRTYYASAWIPERKARVSLHRFILGLRPGPPLVHHKNDQGWDCRRANLQISDAVGNAIRRPKQRGKCSSRFIGVSRCGSKWRAQVIRKGKVVYSRCFYSEIEAAISRDWAFKRHHGKQALLNFPDGLPDPQGSMFGDE
jgi:hypothetical protein